MVLSEKEELIIINSKCACMQCVVVLLQYVYLDYAYSDKITCLICDRKLVLIETNIVASYDNHLF